MCVNLGGAESLEKAIQAQTVNTAVSNSGLEISGQFSRVTTDAVGNVTYVNTAGPTQLSYQGRQISGHGTEFHQSGFGSPVGRLQAMERCLSSYTVDELKAHGIAIGETVCLEFLSGITVTGVLAKIYRQQQKNLLLTFDQCTVTDVHGDVLFHPDWGVFDMAVGDSIVSVYGGSADQDHYPLYQAPSNNRTLTISYDESTQSLFDLYSRVRQLREQSMAAPAAVESLISEYVALTDTEWLLGFELLELAQLWKLGESVQIVLKERLQQLAQSGDNDQQRLIQYGLARLS